MTIRLTDSRGRPLVENLPDVEPEPGSVVLTSGQFGTAWQHHFADGLWHSSRGGRPKTWAEMLTCRGLVLVYHAPVRVERHKAVS